MRSADQIRAGFLDYFGRHAHRVVASSPLVPQNDPTLLFANAGMNQFKDVFLGKEKRDYTRAASSQKCVRAGGKHNDLENVGYTARHHTFFEMLGNFSFGDYFKKEAIDLAWGFLTGEMRLAEERLVVTIFKGDDAVPRDAEAHRFWTAHLEPGRILELGDNFWAMGEVGPCGPCTEIHYNQGDILPCPEEQAGRKCLGVECECDRWLELWNLVFMQYDRSANGTLTPLPAPCVDTGMGLERIAAIVQGRHSNYETDLFAPILDAIAAATCTGYGSSPEHDISMRVVADHLRAMTFLVSDGVLPGNEGRGYVLRKIMRRAMRHGKRLGLEGSFLHRLSSAVVERMKGGYPELLNHAASIERVIRLEEERYASTLKQALAVFEEMAATIPGGGILGGDDAFKLYDTYGLALDFTEELAKERGFTVDRASFERELQAQQERARQSNKMGAVSGDPVYLSLLEKGKTQFSGYTELSLEDATVLAVLRDGQLVSRLDSGMGGEIVLDRTPFYAEGGGQVGDQGVIASADGSAARVVDTQAPLPGLHVHKVEVTSGAFERGMRVRAEVAAELRSGARRHHTATHLLHAALRETLGTHVKQAGSLVAPDRLRFDFSHFGSVSPRELRRLENRVNDEVLRDTVLDEKVMGREEALAYGALAFFGDKYGDRVRVVEVPGFSKEFCGGTHVRSTGEIGLFLFTAEQGISAGTRRVEALAGDAAIVRAQANDGILDELEQTAKVDRHSLIDEYARLREQLKAREREVQDLKMKLATATPQGAEAELATHNGVRLWVPRFEGLNAKAHAAVVDDFRNRHREEPFALLSAAVDGENVHVISAVSPKLAGRLRAPEIMKRLGVRGGGRPEFAQGGGIAPSDVEALRRKASEVLRSMVEGSGAA